MLPASADAKNRLLSNEQLSNRYLNDKISLNDEVSLNDETKKRRPKPKPKPKPKPSGGNTDITINIPEINFPIGQTPSSDSYPDPETDPDPLRD